MMEKLALIMLEDDEKLALIMPEDDGKDIHPLAGGMLEP